ncbi:hypothetical protein ACLMJK_001756 [Lecanora helva]
MFGTLRYDGSGRTHQSTQRAAGPALDQQKQRNLACNRCRSRKVWLRHLVLVMKDGSSFCSLQQRCGGEQDGCQRCKEASIACVYPSFSPEKGVKNRKRSALSRQSSHQTSLSETPPASNEASPSERRKPEKIPRLSPPDLSTNSDVASGTKQNASTSNPRSTDEQPESFPIPSEFLEGIFPGEDFQRSQNYLTDLNLDHYFVDGLSTVDLTPESQDLSTSCEFFHFTSRRIFTEDKEDSLDTDNVGTEVAPISNEMLSDVPSYSSMSLLPDHLLPSEQGSDASENVNLDSNFSVTGSDLASSTVAKSSCDCLSTMFGLTMELEHKSLMADTASLDNKLASQKDFLNRCNAILKCEFCRTRPEYLLLLGMFIQNLTNFCEATVNNYLEGVWSQSDWYSTPQSGSDLSNVEATAQLGQYEVDSQQEWNTLMKVLIILQLQSIETLLRGTKEASFNGSNSILPRVQWPCPTARRIMTLIQRLG